MNNFDYEFQIQGNKQNNPQYTKVSKKNKNYQRFGYIVTKRDEHKKVKNITFSIYTNNQNLKIFLLGNFNQWKITPEEENKFLFSYEDGFHFLEIGDTIKHKDPYKLLVIDTENNTKEIIVDPSSRFFDDEGNSIFWDFEDPSTNKIDIDIMPQLNKRPVKILQTDLSGLITHYANKDGILGHSINEKETYTFIKESGVIEEIKKLGFNTIQFLPFAQSIDGRNWKYRYLVPFQFALQKNWGTPDEFVDMVNEFHKHGIAIIADIVIGHVPHKDYKIFGHQSDNYGIHTWKSKYNNDTYLDDTTSWGTRRFRFSDKKIRNYIVASALHFQENLGIDGFRIDNVDGILRHGENGDGEDREGGRELLRELNVALYENNPHTYVHYEAHYFYGDNAKNLVAPIQSNQKALGASAYNSSRITHYFHTHYMFKGAHEITPWKIKHIMEEKEWGKSNSTVADFHNHDAAAGLMEMRCTGAYAYECMKAETIDQHIHTIGKMKVMEAIISFCCEGRTLDLLQTWLLQTGTFEHDSSIHWYLTFNESNKSMVSYKKRINEIMDYEEFFPEYTHNREFLNVDDTNKVLVVQRESSEHTSIIIINMGSWKLHSYKVGIKKQGTYRLEFNSDEFRYNGHGITSFKEVYKSKESKNFEVLNQEIEFDEIPPYGIIVLRKKR